jgi:hypothetical protein
VCVRVTKVCENASHLPHVPHMRHMALYAIVIVAIADMQLRYRFTNNPPHLPQMIIAFVDNAPHLPHLLHPAMPTRYASILASIRPRCLPGAVGVLVVCEVDYVLLPTGLIAFVGGGVLRAGGDGDLRLLRYAPIFPWPIFALPNPCYHKAWAK